MKTAKDIINNSLQNSNTIDKDKMVIDASSMMERENIDYVLVKEGINCVGIISEMDYMNKIILAGKNPSQVKAIDIMNRNICTADIGDPIHKCLELMNTLKIRHLLVYDNFLFKGVIRLHDLIRAAFKENLHNQIEQEQAKYIHSRSLYI